MADVEELAGCLFTSGDANSKIFTICPKDRVSTIKPWNSRLNTTYFSVNGSTVTILKAGNYVVIDKNGTRHEHFNANDKVEAPSLKDPFVVAKMK